MATISNNNIARAIYAASLETGGKDQSAFLKNVVQFLARKKLLSKSADILNRLNKIMNDTAGRVTVLVRGAEKISDHTKKELKQSLSKRYGGKEIILEERIDEKLLGGLRIEVNDEVIDLTIANRMKKLQDHLKQSTK
jgi:ATP synthase F1 delta subunit